MKRLLCTLLAALCALSALTACGKKSSSPVVFYYLDSAFQDNMVCPIASEEREVAGHQEDLRYLLSFYLMGPIDSGLRSALPRGTLLYTVSQEDSRLTIEISNTTALLSDAEFSLACACLSMTCMGLTQAEEVTVVSGSRSLTLSQSNLLLTDTVTPEETT